MSFAEQAMEGMEGADQKLWWDRLGLELDNLQIVRAPRDSAIGSVEQDD